MTPAESIRTYIRAKDENRPHLLRQAFAPTAIVEVISRSPAISFPPVLTGLDEIANALIGKFGQLYENVYTFCLAEPPARDCRLFTCDWLVGMSEKSGGAVRVGTGRYDWHFAPDAGGLATKLTITIDRMELLEPRSLSSVMAWLTTLPYPWCPADVAAKTAPATFDVDRRPNLPGAGRMQARN